MEQCMTAAPRILWLCKSKYMNHDVIDDRYGRLFELPDCLAKKHAVFAFCLDYRPGPSGQMSGNSAAVWRRSSIPGTFFVGWLISLLKFVRHVRPDCVIASSDCLQVILGALVSRLYGTLFYADLYDDYSTFGLAKIPGMRWLYNKALASADGIFAVSTTLGHDLEMQFPGKPVLVIESTIDAEQFHSKDKMESRKLLGLDHLEGKKLVGVCGGLNAYHGANIVFNAFSEIADRDPNVIFVVAGRLYEECPLPKRSDITYLGMLPHDQMSYFFSALDVAVVALSNTKFGYYAFPQKAYEVLACRVQVAAADVGALSMLFSNLTGALYNPDSSSSLAETVVRQLASRMILDVDIPTWGEQAAKISLFIHDSASY